MGTASHDAKLVPWDKASTLVQQAILETIINPGHILPTLQGDRTKFSI